MATSASRRLPGWAFGVFVVLTSVITAISLTAVWLHRTVLDTEKFVERVGPIIDDPAVEAALGTFVAEQLIVLVDLDGFLDDIVPEQGQILAPVLTNAVQGFLAEEATKFFASDTFDQLWTTALTTAHKATVKVLKGGGDVVQTADGKVVINFIPIINEILTNVEGRINGLFGTSVDIPEIDPSAPPSEARQKLEAAFPSVEIPEDFGQIEVFDSDTLGAMQSAVEWSDKGTIALLILAALLLIITIGLAPDRRHGVMYVAIGIAVVTVVLRRLVFATEDEIMSFVRVEARRDAVNAIVDEIFSSYLDATIILIVIALLAWLVAFAFGPSRPAQAVRGAGDAPWIREHVGLLRAAVIVVAAALVLFSDIGFFGLLIVGVIVGLLMVWLGAISRESATAPAS